MVEAKWHSGSADHHVALTDWLTVERVAYAGLAALALLVRLVGLAGLPLGPAEAAQAWPAFAAAGQTADLAGISPLLWTLQRLTFAALGATDALARFWPALFGGLAVLCFFALRDRLTRGGALLAALLWALSPLAVWTGRQGTGAALVAPLTLALLAALNQLATGDRRPVQFAAVGIALGLLLIAGPGAYTALLGLLIAALIWRRRGAAPLTLLFGGVAGVRTALLAALLALGVGATCFFSAPAGLAAAGELLGMWWRNLRPGAGEYGAWDVMRRLLISEPLLLGFALAGLIAALRRGERFGAAAGAATGVALLIALIANGRHPADLGLIALGLALLAGPAVAGVLRAAWAWRGEADPWLLLALSLVLVASAAIAFPNYLNATQPNNVATYAAVAGITLTLALALWLVYGIWGSWAVVAGLLPLLPLIVGLIWDVGQVSALSFDRDPGRRAAVLNEAPDANFADFRATLGGLSALKGGGAHEARVDVLLPASSAGDLLTPMLRWTLRDFPTVRFVRALPADPAPIVITAAEPQPEAFSARYGGADFIILRYWRPDSLTGSKAWLRWLLYREAPQAESGRRIVLWINREGK